MLRYEAMKCPGYAAPPSEYARVRASTRESPLDTPRYLRRLPRCIQGVLEGSAAYPGYISKTLKDISRVCDVIGFDVRTLACLRCNVKRHMLRCEAMKCPGYAALPSEYARVRASLPWIRRATFAWVMLPWIRRATFACFMDVHAPSWSEKSWAEG